MPRQSYSIPPLEQNVQASDLVILSYWPNVGSKHIGYGCHKYAFFGLASLLLFLLVHRLLYGLITLNLFPVLSLLFIGSFCMFWIIFLRKCYVKRIIFVGFYEVDIQGRAIRLLIGIGLGIKRGEDPTVIIRGMPMGRRRFLRTIQG